MVFSGRGERSRCSFTSASDAGNVLIETSATIAIRETACASSILVAMRRRSSNAIALLTQAFEVSVPRATIGNSRQSAARERFGGDTLAKR